VNSSLGVVKVRPSIDINTWCPLPVGPRCSEELPSGGAREGPCRAARGHLRSGDATFRTRSALVVLPDCDGLLHLVPSRFVAPWCRSWGSPGCCFRNHFRALSRGSPVRLHRIPAWPSPSPRGDSVWTSPFWLVRLLRGGDVHAITATGSSVGCVGFPTGAPPFEAFPLPAAGAASTVPRVCVAVRSGRPRRTWKFLPLRDIAVVWSGPPRSVPSRRCSRLVRPFRVPSANGWCLSGLPWSVTRPQGFVPPSSP
jgi:hypothetical protein